MARRFVPVCVVVLVLGAVVASGASAAKPTIERIAIDEVFEDAFLSEACGFPVVSHARGQIAIRQFDREGPGLQEVFTINLTITATANGRTYRLRDVGADIVRITPDGTEILMAMGQIPFGWAGVMKIDLTTGEVIHEPPSNREGQLEQVCAALRA